MSAARARRAAGRGYTLIEVMAALGVLAIGATGVLALQKATLISNTNARNLAIANSIAMTWAERLRVDALQWNEPLSDPNTDLAARHQLARAQHHRPRSPKVTPTEIIALGAPSADVLGADIYADDTSASAFCTHVRFRQFTVPVSGALIWDSLIRAEIRVVWERSGDLINCTITPFDRRHGRGAYGAVYLTTGVLGTRASDDDDDPPHHPPPRARARASGQRGFTLVELLVAMAAGLVVSLAAFLLSKNATRFFQNEARASASHLAATIGLNRLTADLQRAAYLSSPNILDDPEVCQVPPSPASACRRLAGISILRQGSEFLHGARLNQSIANGLHPDSIIIGGSLNSTELFEFRKISDESGDWARRAATRTAPPCSARCARAGRRAEPDPDLRSSAASCASWSAVRKSSCMASSTRSTWSATRLTRSDITLRADPGLPTLCRAR